MLVTPQAFMHDYFSANTSIDRGWVKNGFLAAWRTVSDTPAQRDKPEGATQRVEALEQERRLRSTLLQKGDTGGSESAPEPSEETHWRNNSASITVPSHTPSLLEALPHRRRKLLREGESRSAEPTIPPDASSQLTTAAANLPSSASLRRVLATYLSLTKPRLSFLVVLTTTTAYSLYPIPDILSTATGLTPHTISTSTLTLLFLTTGTFLSSACANTLNMLMEPKHDALMSRTRNRPLVRNLLSTRAAALFAFCSGIAGLALLDLGTNSTVAFLSALNIFLYAGVYTPMKRLSVLNTWAGALVGGIPPLMGWAAAAGSAATSEHHSWKDLLFSEESLGGWLLAGLLFAWQFPHFNAISHTIKDEYRQAGFRMLAWVNPAMNGRVAIRYSLAMFPICAGLWWAGIVNGGFMVISTACNAWMTREAFKFWRTGGAGGSARGLFWASVWQLPLVMVGALVCKNGIWDGMFGHSEGQGLLSEDGPHDSERIGEDALNPSAGIGKKPQMLGDINLAMMGFKRPS